MTNTTFNYIAALLLLTNFCQAQSDSHISKDTSLQTKYFNSYNSNFYFPSPLQTDNYFSIKSYNNLSQKLNFSERDYCQPIRYNPILFKRDFIYKYNPLNLLKFRYSQGCTAERLS